MVLVVVLAVVMDEGVVDDRLKFTDLSSKIGTEIEVAQ